MIVFIVVILAMIGVFSLRLYKTQAVVTEGEVSEYVFLNRARIAENEESTNTAIVEIEEALCELDTASTENATAVEDALCELDEMIMAMSGGEN